MRMFLYEEGIFDSAGLDKLPLNRTPEFGLLQVEILLHAVPSLYGHLARVLNSRLPQSKL